MNRNREIVENLLNQAGIHIGGNSPWDINVMDERFFKSIIKDGELGLGESFMKGWWDSPSMDQMIFKLFEGNIHDKVKENINTLLWIAFTKITNYQSKNKAKLVGLKHYDVGNKLFSLMLDKRMNYSCGYWENTDNLDAAQENKLELICKKLQLKPGMKVLDIGCGWGAFGKYAAENYDIKTKGITISKNQKELGEKLCTGLPVTFELKDYRELSGKYDRIVSIGMLEHVGFKNYKNFFKTVNNCLVDDGIALIHTIGSNRTVTTTSAWLDKYIFPNGMIPSIKQIGEAIERSFVMEDLHNFGHYYDTTLMAWFNNFDSNWNNIKDDYNNEFYRMWKYYLLTNAASFRARYNQLWQIVLTKKGFKGGYKSIR